LYEIDSPQELILTIEFKTSVDALGIFSSLGPAIEVTGNILAADTWAVADP
jgi:hypothetical protein